MALSPEDWYSSWKRWDKSEFGKPTGDEAAYCDAELGPLVAPKHAHVLEIGFGNGGVLGWCRQRGYDCVGVESNPALVVKAREAGYEAFGSLEDVRNLCGNHAIDLAVAFDVLEHLSTSEILEVMRGIHILLKPEAVLIARFPNGDSPFGRAHQHADITHTTALGSGKAQWLASQSGFIVDRFKEPAVPLRGAGVLRICKRLSAKGIRWVFGWLIGHAYFLGAVRVFSANIVAIFRISNK